MKKNPQLAIIGSGASAIYLLKHVLDHVEILKGSLGGISIVEKSPIMGMGMPYSPLNTDRYHMSNISSEELPELNISFAQWLREQDRGFLVSLGVEDAPISESEVYSRLALGRYLNSQYQLIVGKLRAAGLGIRESPGCEVSDILESAKDGTFELLTADGSMAGFDKVIIATGHRWAEEDRPEDGYYASPWPVSKLLPAEGQYYDFEIGTLGASLSAFDVLSSLAHRHGKFTEESGKWVFLPHPGSENFRIIMHSANGMLPHLQFDQVNPLRKIYRHVDRGSLLGLVDENGFLRLELYYDKVCRPTLADAFRKDGMEEMVAKLIDPGFGLDSFVATMSAKHEYANAFEGMRVEMVEAGESVKNHRPVHWKEVMDDLIYTLNFHCELMPAEDHLRLKGVVMPFLMNVIAAMPLDSANTILALHDAGKLDMIPGKVTLSEIPDETGKTTILVEHDGESSSARYRMFIDCSGQKALELEEYPFPSLVNNGLVRKARVSFIDPAKAAALPEEKQNHLFQNDGELLLHTGGVDIDGAYRIIGQDGKADQRIHDIAFPHTSGVRPYSYGLQACNDTSEIVVRAWLQEIRAGKSISGDVMTTTEIYRKIQ